MTRHDQPRDRRADQIADAAADPCRDAGETADGRGDSGQGDPDPSGDLSPRDADADREAGVAPAAEPLMSVDAVLHTAAAHGVTPESPASDQLVAIVEALIFASPEPLAQKQLMTLLETEPREEVEAAIAELRRRYDARAGALQLVEVAGGHQIVTRPDLHEWVRRLFHERTTQKLSVQALETLAVIAYKQPITAAEITEIRGVNTAGVIGTLLERSLVKIGGRKQVVGRPFLYSTTREFLDRFGLKDLGDLPKVEEMADALGFEPPAGFAREPLQSSLLVDETATPEDAEVISGEVADGEDEGEQ